MAPANQPFHQSGDQIQRGIIYMCLATLLVIPLMNTFAKTLVADFHVIQVVWARFTGHLLCMTLLFFPNRGWRLYRSNNIRLQLLRSTLMMISNSCFIGGLATVALASASAIMFTAPLVVTILAVVMLGERVGWHRRIAVVVGLLGALIIIRPGMSIDGSGNAGALLIVVSAVSFSFYQILTRKLAPVDSPETLIIYTALIASIVMSAIVPFYFTAPASVWQWLMMILLGIAGAFAQFFIVKAVQYAPVSVVAPFQYAELIGATLFGLLIFRQFPDGWTWLGAAIIVACGMYIAYRERVA
jgi:drug/metabolite transporter (DMT)-like permease